MSKLGLGLAIAFFTAALSMTGCMAPCGTCGPIGGAIGPVGPGCIDTNCNDCDGACASNQYVARGPLDALRNARQRMVCGSGCGEAYVGEWISTPPYASDPCCGDQFVGGGTRCRPFCWQPGGLLFGLRGLYGERFCSGNQSSTPCPCGDNFCDRRCGMATTTSYSQPVVSSPVMSAPVMSAPVTSGCSTCSANARSTQSRVVASNGQPAADAATQQKIVATQRATVKKTAKQVVR